MSKMLKVYKIGMEKQTCTYIQNLEELDYLEKFKIFKYMWTKNMYS